MANDILIVDDSPENLLALGTILRDRGYTVRPAHSGEMALKVCAAHPPDLCLLDITMPGMDGYEVCARLKSDSQTKEIPVVFVSAHTDVHDKIKAFEAGGLDYITKPFHIDEVTARVATHLLLHRQRLELEADCHRIRRQEEFRKTLTRLIVHDLRSPLVALRGFLDLMERSDANLDPKTQRCLSLAKSSGRTLLDMANSLLDIDRLEQNAMKIHSERVDLAELCRDAVSHFSSLLDNRTIIVESSSEPAVAEVDRNLMLRIILNILSNALKFTDRATGCITLRTDIAGDDAVVAISNDGPEIPAEYHDRIFEKFIQVEGSQIPGVHSTGLGLSLVKLGIEAHGGKVCLQSGAGKGTTFCLTLPRQGSRGALGAN